jgi:hypothetical protein
MSEGKLIVKLTAEGGKAKNAYDPCSSEGFSSHTLHTSR